MKYLKNLKSYFNIDKVYAKPKTFAFDFSDVIDNIENSFVELNNEYNIDIKCELQEKFIITIYKKANKLSETNFNFYDVKDQVLFMLEIIKSSNMMNELNVYFRGIDLDYTRGRDEMTFTKIEDLEKADNIETSGITIYFYLS